MGSGTLRLLDAEVRRNVVEYHAAWANAFETMTLFSAGKPRYADLVPARAKGPMAGGCFRSMEGLPTDCVGEFTDSAFARLAPAERADLAAWRDLPGIRSDLQSELTETQNLLRVFGSVRNRLNTALAAVRNNLGP